MEFLNQRTKIRYSTILICTINDFVSNSISKGHCSPSSDGRSGPTNLSTVDGSIDVALKPKSTANIVINKNLDDLRLESTQVKQSDTEMVGSGDFMEAVFQMNGSGGRIYLVWA
ncbi:unnamed protein product [Adineta ricciae]|uniref:Uncharacterized protein n=1 Tax=Adineta ricciae TaxID=249248 RepID=A0A815PB95_ADIRI|nr:unnamed protein product [Adineta ricciae]